MLIGGLQKLSLIDYPGKLAATVFTVGCNFHCPFCHNSDLVLPEKIKNHPLIAEKDFFKFLKTKKGLLEGVCITGGEPTIHNDLADFIAEIKELGFLVKLDTNGSNPNVLKDLIKNDMVDYLAMDIKAPLKKYPQLAKSKINLKNIDESAGVVRGAPDYEFRTTVVPSIINKEGLLAIAHWLQDSRKYFLQQFVPQKTIDSAFEKMNPYPEQKLKEFCQMLQPYFETCQVRL